MCRAFLSPYSVDGEEFYVGRANIGAVSLNLPMMVQEHKLTKVPLEDIIDKWLEVGRKFHKRRFEAIANTKASTNPLCFTQGGIRGGTKKPNEDIGHEILKGFTASFGVTSLHEVSMLLYGVALHETNHEQYERIRALIDYIKDKIHMFTLEDGHLYALYGTPAESLCGTQRDQFVRKYGEIPGVTDNKFFTNSFHMHVSAEISPLTKQDKEEELFHRFTGGRINYVRIEDGSNKQAIADIVKRGMKKGFYQGVNFELVVCDKCGYRPFKAVEICPKCKSDELTITARTCGYLGYVKVKGRTRFNEAKLDEINKRKSM